ncbi:ABC transporter substrate-binding protein [Phytophthora palmivora]|uniref:ABC transporter substrate-binding protein n=1 Tax=Phytophthora palmivora TaxID=4796 RepID=A0A2P4X214_9STRA|nr:ABC transporter substrate-binding protein [Phytophthora palmivora]
MESHRPERYNVFVTIIPLNLVNILQPLDVPMTHSSQAFYQNNNGEYIGGVMQDPAIQITKFPATTQWVNGLWVFTRTPENVNKAFEICSLVPKELLTKISAGMHPTIIYCNRQMTKNNCVLQHMNGISQMTYKSIFLPHTRIGISDGLCDLSKRLGKVN